MDLTVHIHPMPHSQVVDLQKYWVFESDVHGTKDAVLKECCGVLIRAIQTIHDKAEVRLTILRGCPDALFSSSS